MDHYVLSEILEIILSRAKDKSAKHIRVVQLAVYDPHIQPAELIQTFERLTQDTLVQGARLYIRSCKHNSLPTLGPLTITHTSPPIRLDSIELE
jgi:Zn finger protein HypA/HybF involved in hydrogenase expression